MEFIIILLLFIKLHMLNINSSYLFLRIPVCIILWLTLYFLGQFSCKKTLILDVIIDLFATCTSTCVWITSTFNSWNWPTIWHSGTHLSFFFLFVDYWFDVDRMSGYELSFVFGKKFVHYFVLLRLDSCRQSGANSFLYKWIHVSLLSLCCNQLLQYELLFRW